MKKITLSTFLLFFSVIAFSQVNLWKKTSDKSTNRLEKTLRKSTPKEYNLYQLNLNDLKAELASVSTAKSSSKTLIIPGPYKTFQKFEVIEASNLAPELAAQFPNIKSYIGKGLDDPTAIARFSIANDGLHIMISSGKYSTFYIDPYTKNNENYIAYTKSSLPELVNDFNCLVDNTASALDKISSENQVFASNDGNLRTYRLALACTGEYAQFHLNQQGVPGSATDAVKKAAVLSAMNTTMTRVNGVYERDVAVRMVIVANNTSVIFLNAATDNLDNNDAGTLIDQSQTVCDANIGSANYDIGHTFSTGGGGLAALGVPCINGSKAQGITGSSTPMGDPYDIDYVAHELGHQFGANHTQNNSCNRNNATAVEPGSGSTIMGYAGICPPNVQSNSDAHFHAASIAEMLAVISGNTCDVETSANNAAPTINPIPNYTVPKSTPLVLQGNATDADSGDALTYCWEQTDTTPATQPPVSTNTAGPAFRSLSPSTSPDRYLPVLSRVLAGHTTSADGWEVIPSVARTMNFALTVRDNHVGGGITTRENTTITVNGSAGPFTVSSQNSNVTWNGGETKTITWNKANTDVAPVNCSNVKILLSIDGGATFPTVLAASTPNDGSHSITVPGVGNSTQARIMVMGVDNIFYNVNSTNFTINSVLGVNDFSFGNFNLYPNPSTGQINLSFTKIDNSATTINLFDVRGRLINTQSYSNNNINFNETLNFQSVETGIYFLTIRNGAKEQTKKIIIK
ncbi:zinc-dependent metalloprotease [Pseudofulvibacter geojedonensis]|uniref:Reprolysin-like metallopeptidase n=1 Tax=Pseudofulvibacter geojedonensis TaxID=1123758 RepID=A0ABW3I4E7_9FLAO